MEELRIRHRQEQRDLQSRITQKKKQASKKTRKGVNDECERLEAELKERHQAEAAALSGDTIDVTPTQSELDALTLAVDEDPPPAAASATVDVQPKPPQNTIPTKDGSPPRKQNRQKARLARRTAEAEEQARIAAEEAENLPDLKEQERERMLSAMKEHGLQEKEIRADGHCLYSAVADQLIQQRIPLTPATDAIPVQPFRTIRLVAADYIESHKDDFVPFLEEPLDQYLHKIRDTGEWGGQLELMALARYYGTDINVLQDFGRVEKIEAGKKRDDRKDMWLGYYKHGFGLGEHYNSLRRETT